MSKETTNTAQFTGLRANLWPIHTYELKKFLPLAFIMFCLLFNYTVLRDTKDSIVVNSGGGAAAINFLKLYCVTPAAILFVILYAKLTNVLSRENVFYVVVTPFLVFFGLFAFVLYPNIDILHPSIETISALNLEYPRLSGFINIYGYWTYSLFYVSAEIWGSAMIALMFWQFANHVVRMTESKRFYGLFAVIGNVALIFSGQAVGFCSKGVDFQTSLYMLMSLVVVFGILAMMLYRWMHTAVLSDKRFFDSEEQAGKTKKKKEKLSLTESAKMIFRSPELGLIALLIMAYGVTINLVEIQWKNQLSLFTAGDKSLYNYYMGQFSSFTGLFTILFGLFVGANILRRVSWGKAASITPLIITIGGGLFFSFICLQDFVGFILEGLNTTSVVAATVLGAIVIIVGKAVKYILFDSTKEMAYIPLDDELKTKGKAAVDVIGGRAGKAGGAFVQSNLLMLFATKDVILIAPWAFAVFAIVCVAWLFAVKVLAVKVDAAVARRAQETGKAA